MHETKLHILKIAFKLFLQKNFKEVTMQDIVKETGLSKGAFYHYFESKEQLFLEVVSTFYLADEITNYEALDKSSFKNFYLSYIVHLENFVGYLKNLVDVKEDDHNNINYFTLIFDALNRFPDFQKKIKESHAKELAIWQETIEKAQKNQEISSLMPSLYTAKMFIYTIDSTFMHSILEGNFMQALQEIRILWGHFYTQLKK